MLNSWPNAELNAGPLLNDWPLAKLNPDHSLMAGLLID